MTLAPPPTGCGHPLPHVARLPRRGGCREDRTEL